MCHLAFQDVDYITVQTMHSGKSTDFSIGPSIGPKSLLSPPTCHPREIWTGWYYYILQQTEYLK